MDSISSVTPAPFADSPAGTRRGMFITDSGQSVLVTFLLLLSLFALWGFCNGMIDVMDKHFLACLNLSLGYLLMAIPAGWLATKLGYKGGIIVGLLMVSAGGFWFYPATQIDKFWAFLVGVCFIAAGLTFLETIANPYAAVLGPQQYSATRINLAQSTNGFALGIFGLGEEAKKASSFLVMAICGSAVVPQIMGAVGNAHGMFKAFVVPLLCYAFVGAYGCLWPRLGGHEVMVGVNTTKGH